jgi:hypothetical protein
VSGRGERDGRLLFLSADSVPYTTVSDTGGTFRLPGLPEGEYEAVGWMDQNRNFLYDPAFEPGAVVPFTMAAGGRVTGLDVVMLPADTTPPRVASAEAVDSVTIRVSFDDPLDPDADADSVPPSVAVRDSVTGAAVAVDSFVVGIPAAAGPLPGDEPGAAPDEAEDGAAEDELEPEPEAEAEVEPEPEPEVELLRGDELARDRLLPGAGPSPPGGGTEVLPPAPTEVTILLSAPLAEGVYEVNLTGFANLRGLRGGGVARFGYAPPPPPDPAVAPDSAAVAPDSAVVAPDSAAAEPESP